MCEEKELEEIRKKYPNRFRPKDISKCSTTIIAKGIPILPVREMGTEEERLRVEEYVRNNEDKTLTDEMLDLETLEFIVEPHKSFIDHYTKEEDRDKQFEEFLLKNKEFAAFYRKKIEERRSNS